MMADSRFASREDVYGECPRSGKRVLLHEMVPDGYVKGLMVHRDWYDPPHPQESLGPIQDPISVQNPSPDLTRSKVVVTFPTYDIMTDKAYSGMEISFILGKPVAAVVTNPLNLLVTDTGDWFVTDTGASIGVAP